MRRCFSLIIGRWTGVRALLWYAWAIDAAVLLPAARLLSRTCSRPQVARFLAGAGLAATVRHLFLCWLAGRAPTERTSAGDPLSLARFSAGNTLAGMVAAGVRDRRVPATRLAWGFALFAATALDWLDGPLARRSGATRHGAVLDIEADSWLTLWTAAAGAAWGGLPRWVILPPLVRYLHPLLDLRRGPLPHGGGPALSRITGSAQMALLLAALAPIRWRPPRAAVIAVAGITSGSQFVVTIVQLSRRMMEPRMDHRVSSSAALYTSTVIPRSRTIFRRRERPRTREPWSGTTAIEHDSKSRHTLTSTRHAPTKSGAGSSDSATAK